MRFVCLIVVLFLVGCGADNSVVKNEVPEGRPTLGGTEPGGAESSESNDRAQTMTAPPGE